MRLFLKSRAVGRCAAFVILFELSVALWGMPALVVRHSLSAYAVPLSVFGQIVPAAAVAFSAGSAHDQLERLSSRPIWMLRLHVIVVLLLLAAAATTVACAVLGSQGTLDALAPLRAVLGLCGAALAFSAVVDRRLAGIVAGLLVLFPLVFDPDASPLGRVLGFVVGEPGWASWSTCLVLAALGMIAVALPPRRVVH